MAKRKEDAPPAGAPAWMATFSDLMNLLLCFFVLLYSISTIDAEKWMIVVRSFNRDAMVNEPENPPGPAPDNQDSTGGDGMPALSEVEEDLTELYKYLKNLAAAEGEGTITVTQGTGYVFISFNDAIFFDGDSSVLRADGKAILDSIIPALAEASPYIDELKVLGHTAQMYADRPNPNVAGDRHLASVRATEVIIYLQNHIPHETLHPGRLVVESFGQWRNIAPNDVEANRAKNRRVELVISGRDLEEKMNNEFDSYFGIYGTPDQSGTIPSYTTSD